jgi:inositol transport system substrate-binding protein
MTHRFFAGRSATRAAGALLLAAVACTACSSTKSTSAAPASSSTAATVKQLVVGWSVYGLQAEFAVLLNHAVQNEAQKLGVKVLTYDGKYDANTQNGQIQDAIAQNVNALVVDPISTDGENPVIGQAMKAHIPVIGVNAFATASQTSYAGSYDPIAGQMEMEHMAAQLHGTGNIVILQGPIGQSGQIGRDQGIADVLKRNPGIHVLAKQTANWQRDQALTLMENWIQQYGSKINGVVAENDDMASGAIGALKQAGLAGKIPVVGVDGIIAGLQNVQSGNQIGSVFQDAYAQGQKALDLAVAAAKGQKVPKNLRIPFIWVDKSNVAKFLNKRYCEEAIAGQCKQAS